MGIAFSRASLEPALVERSRLVDLAKFFQRLTTVVIGGHIGIIVLEEYSELLYGFFELAGVRIFGRQAVAGERIARVLVNHCFKNLETISRHASHCGRPAKFRVPYSVPVAAHT